MKGNKGFTLLEMLASVAILLVIFAGAMRVLALTSELSEMAPLRLESVRKATMVFEQLRKDLAGAHKYSNGGDATNFRLVDRGGSYPSHDELTFVTAADNRSASDFVEVMYYLDAAKKILYRIERPYRGAGAKIADEPFITPPVEPELRKYAFALGVGSFEMKAAASAGGALSDSWTGKPVLPASVRIILTTESSAVEEGSSGALTPKFKATRVSDIFVPNGG